MLDKEHTFVSLSSQLIALEVLTTLLSKDVEQPATLDQFLLDSAKRFVHLLSPTHLDPYSLHFHQVVHTLDSLIALSLRVKSPTAS
jgi:hypothetical protein